MANTETKTDTTETAQPASLRAVTPADAPALADALGKRLAHLEIAAHGAQDLARDWRAGVVVGHGTDRAAQRNLQKARRSLVVAATSYEMNLAEYRRAIVKLQDGLKAALLGACDEAGVSLPEIARSLGIAITDGMTIAELGADVRAKREADAQYKAAVAELAAEKNEIKVRRTHPETMSAIDLRHAYIDVLEAYQTVTELAQKMAEALDV